MIVYQTICSCTLYFRVFSCRDAPVCFVPCQKHKSLFKPVTIVLFSQRLPDLFFFFQLRTFENCRKFWTSFDHFFVKTTGSQLIPKARDLATSKRKAPVVGRCRFSSISLHGDFRTTATGRNGSNEQKGCSSWC